ncbi:hypothetical protein EK904_007579 [Melospiza melodia maxima]|nr:hypothetical protein EK904_007579 [Melospiza melodia maxima]
MHSTAQGFWLPQNAFPPVLATALHVVREEGFSQTILQSFLVMAAFPHCRWGRLTQQPALYKIMLPLTFGPGATSITSTALCAAGHLTNICGRAGERLLNREAGVEINFVITVLTLIYCSKTRIKQPGASSTIKISF